MARLSPFAPSAQHHGTGLSSDFGVEFRSAARAGSAKRLKRKANSPLFTLGRIRGILCNRNNRRP
jgi:hypothetical protein